MGNRIWIEPLWDGIYCSGYFAKGHLVIEEFIDAVLRQCGGNEPIKPKDVKHTYWRWVPLPKGSDADMRPLSATPGTPGAFPVTYMDNPN